MSGLTSNGAVARQPMIARGLFVALCLSFPFGPKPQPTIIDE
jgi:hypothetical protein